MNRDVRDGSEPGNSESLLWAGSSWTVSAPRWSQMREGTRRTSAQKMFVLRKCWDVQLKQKQLHSFPREVKTDSHTWKPKPFSVWKSFPPPPHRSVWDHHFNLYFYLLSSCLQLSASIFQAPKMYPIFQPQLILFCPGRSTKWHSCNTTAAAVWAAS